MRKLIPVSGALALAGQYPEIVAAFPEMVSNAAEIGAGVAASPMAEMYPDINWETAFRRMGELASEAWDWTEEAASVKAPILLVFADADSMTGEHVVAMYRAFGGFARDASYDGSLQPKAQLAILPGRTHYNILETTEVATLVEKFLRQ
ncbi:alpha/beta fold hydrolase [Pseudaminobacter soli (ex Li et al. 2025)]|uniref:alpha/beta fold hydrolase n=1 Tax=Pseudaminobacter soli (ex Li et al. 2025) TaxID=1295366 RepID=UPI0011B23812|nr:hypothetical protein [Mesorhizobium soli]